MQNAPYIEGNKVVLSKTYEFGQEKISELVFGEVTAAEIGEIPMWEKQKLKDYYPLVCALTGITPGNFKKLGIMLRSF